MVISEARLGEAARALVLTQFLLHLWPTVENQTYCPQ
jgi:hypothetical protein